MALTVSDIVTKVQERFADAISDTVVDYVNFVHRDLVSAIPEVARNIYDIHLQADRAKYGLPADTLEVALALYVTDPTTASKLARTSEDRLIEELPTWDFDASSIPTQFYVQGDNQDSPQSNAAIFLYPKPATASDADTFYPRVRCYITECKPLLIDTELPEGLATHSLYLEGASYYAAHALRGPAMASPYWQSYQSQIAFCRHRWTSMQPQTPPTRTYPLDRSK